MRAEWSGDNDKGHRDFSRLPHAKPRDDVNVRHHSPAGRMKVCISMGSLLILMSVTRTNIVHARHKCDGSGIG